MNIIYEAVNFTNLNISIRAKCWCYQKSGRIIFNNLVKMQIIAWIIGSYYGFHIKFLKERNHIAGNITNRGISSVNALGTPLGRYQKIVADSIGSRWYTYVEQKRDLISIGTLRLRFYVERSGKVKGLKITENSSNEAFANVCVQSVLEANLPPIPEDIANTLPPEGLEVDGLGFIIFPNR